MKLNEQNEAARNPGRYELEFLISVAIVCEHRQWLHFLIMK